MKANVGIIDMGMASVAMIVVRQSRMKLAAAINEKIGTAAPHPVLAVTEFDAIIIEKTLDPAKRAALDFAQAVLVSA